MYPDYIMAAVRVDLNIGDDDQQFDLEIYEMAKAEVLQRYLNANGAQRNAESVRDVVADIWGVTLH